MAVNKELSQAVRDAIDKIKTDDIDKVAAEVAQKGLRPARQDLQTAINYTNGVRQRNMLTSAQMFRFTVWVDSQRDLIGKARWSKEKIAEEFNAKHDYKVSVGNVAQALKTLDIKNVRTKSGGARHEPRLRAATAKWVLARLSNIEQQLGIVPPPKPAADPAAGG